MYNHGGRGGFSGPNGFTGGPPFKRPNHGDHFRPSPPSSSSGAASGDLGNKKDVQIASSIANLRRNLSLLASDDPMFLRGLIAETETEKLKREHKEMVEQLSVLKEGKKVEEQISIKRSDTKDELVKAVQIITKWIEEKE